MRCKHCKKAQGFKPYGVRSSTKIRSHERVIEEIYTCVACGRTSNPWQESKIFELIEGKWERIK